MDNAEQAARAARAVREFNKLVPSLESFAQSAIGDPAIQVRAAAIPSASGRVIGVRPPLALADVPEHDFRHCDERDGHRLTCPACAVQEEIYAQLHHSIGHHIANTFDKRNDFELAEAVRRGAEQADNPGFSEWVSRSADELVDLEAKGPYEYAYALDPNFHQLFVIIADVYVNRIVAEHRPGAETARWHQAELMLDEGIESPKTGKMMLWIDAPIQAQFLAGLLMAAQGHRLRERFADAVDAMTKLDQFQYLITRPISDMVEAMEVATAFFGLFQKLGIFDLDLDEMEGNDGHGLADSDPDRDGNGGRHDGGDPVQPERGDRGTTPLAQGDGASGQGDVPGGNSGVQGKGDGQLDADSDDASDQQVRIPGANQGGDSLDPSQIDPGMAGAGNDGDQAAARNPGDGDDPAREGDDSGDFDRGIPAPANPLLSPVVDFAEADPTPALDPAVSALRDAIQDLRDSLTPEELAEFTNAASGHQRDAAISHGGGAPVPDDVMDAAVRQALAFDSTSYAVTDQRVYEPGEGGAWAIGWQARAAQFPPPDPAALAPTKLHARRIFSDAAIDRVTHGHRSGRLSAKGLARAGADDGRVFRRRDRAQGKDDEVLIGLDISASTRGPLLSIIKSCGLQMAEILDSVRVPFSVWAHTTGPLGDRIVQELYAVKRKEDPWSERHRALLAGIRSMNGSLDGHNFEFYRKRLESSSSDRRTLVYFTDGEIPFQNPEEEARIITRELGLLRSLGIHVMGVGVGTDSPKRLGIDTIRIDSGAEIGKVLRELDRRITA